MGEKVVREEAVVIPAQIYLEQHIAYTYHCNCHDPKTEAKYIITAPVPSSVIKNSLASASTIAMAAHNKFEMHVPLYRQRNEWFFYGLEVSDKTLGNWINQAAEEWLIPIYELLHHYVLKKSVVHADERTWQIIRRSDGKPGTSKSRMWVVTTPVDDEQGIAYYHSSLTRSQEVAEELLQGFSGYVHADGYQVYKNLDNVVQSGCWAHVRRKFFDVGFTTGLAAQGVALCDAMFSVESQLKSLDADERIKMRQLKLKPVIDRFFEWLETINNPSGKLKEAVKYARNQKESLQRVLEDGRLELSNNLAERCMRPIAVNRKNVLFSTSEKGAKANAIYHTLIETAKLHGLIPYEYLRFLLEHLPNTDFRRNPDLLEEFLPWSNIIKMNCSTRSPNPWDNVK